MTTIDIYAKDGMYAKKERRMNPPVVCHICTQMTTAQDSFRCGTCGHRICQSLNCGWCKKGSADRHCKNCLW